MARWIHLPNNSVPLGIPEPQITIQSDASKTGIGFMVNSHKYHMTLDKSMEHYSINVLELLAIWMATLKVKRGNIINRSVSNQEGLLKNISPSLHIRNDMEESISDEVDPISSTHQRNLQCNSGSAVPQHCYNNRMVTTKECIQTRSSQV